MQVPCLISGNGAKLLAEAAFVAIGEATMAPRSAIDAIDACLRDVVRRFGRGLEHFPYGGKLFLLCGDWRHARGASHFLGMRTVIQGRVFFACLNHLLRGSWKTTSIQHGSAKHNMRNQSASRNILLPPAVMSNPSNCAQRWTCWDGGCMLDTFALMGALHGVQAHHKHADGPYGFRGGSGKNSSILPMAA